MDTVKMKYIGKEPIRIHRIGQIKPKQIVEMTEPEVEFHEPRGLFKRMGYLPVESDATYLGNRIMTNEDNKARKTKKRNSK